MWRAVGFRLFELLVGAIVGWLCYYFAADQEALLGIVAALLVALLVGHAVAAVKHSKDVLLLDERLRDVIKWHVDTLGPVAALAPMLKHGICTIEKDEVANAWLDFVWIPKRRYWATNYESVLWNSSIDDKIIKIQRTQIDVLNVDIRRVFVLRDETELDRYRSVISKQREAGIKVGWILDKTISAKRHLAREMAKAECTDFSVADSQLLFLVRTNRRQDVIRAEIVASREKCEEHERIFMHLFSESSME